DKVRIGLIGAGSRGNQLLGTFLDRPEVDVVAIADVDDRHTSETAEKIKKERGSTPTTTRDYHVIHDSKTVDAVVSATPDRWLGPAPQRPFNLNRFHLLFRWYFDYAGGMMSDWGVHLNDIVLWALDAKAPLSVTASGGIFTSDDDRDTPDTLQVIYDFPGCT